MNISLLSGAGQLIKARFSLNPNRYRIPPIFFNPPLDHRGVVKRRRNPLPGTCSKQERSVISKTLNNLGDRSGDYDVSVNLYDVTIDGELHNFDQSFPGAAA